MSNTCCILSPLFVSPVNCFSQFATNFTSTSEISVILQIIKCLPSNAKKKLVVKIVEDKLEEAFFDDIRRDVQLGNFILLNVPISQQLHTITSLYFFSFLN